MPAITSLGHVIFDASGDPLSGGKLRVYTANTTTPANLFSDEGLTVALTNPVVANSEGRPSSDGSNECIVYAAAGDYDIAELTPADVVLRSWDDFSPGGESGDAEQTVTGNGRYKLTGSAGTVIQEYGDPSPDNSGGTSIERGWNGTQGDTKTFDFALLNVTGRLKENGKQIGSTVQTEETAFSAVSALDIALPNAPTGTRRWRVTIYDLVVSTALQLRLRLSYAASLKSGGSDYAYACRYTLAADETWANSKSTGSAEMIVDGENWQNVSNRPSRIVLEITTPDSGNDATTVHALGDGWKSFGGTSYPTQARLFGSGLGNFGRADAIRLYPSTGTITGKYTVEALND